MNQFKKIALMSATTALFAFASVGCSKDSKVDDPAAETKTDKGGEHPTGDHPAKTDGDHPAKTDEDDEKKEGDHPAKTDEPAADHPSGDHPSK